MNFNNYKFRASEIGILMTKSRSKSDPISETAKTRLREIFIREKYGREKLDLRNKFTEKGNMCEADSFELVKKVTGEIYFKNEKRLENEFICGTPDGIKSGVKVLDTKTSWDIWTFAEVNEKKATKDYYYQILSYMWLANVSVGDLVYCLVDTPEIIINDEVYRASFKYPELNNGSEEILNNFKKNYLFNDIPENERVKKYEFVYSDEAVKEVIEGVKLWREYLNGLSL